MFTLLIDDVRELHVDITARTAKSGKAILQKMHSDIDLLCIDHDLGCEENGYDIIKWAFKNQILPKTVQVVSMNPVGRENIEKFLANIGYRKVKWNWVKI